MSMIERVAKAIYEGISTVAGGDLPDDWHALGPDHDAAREEWMRIARAAIEALREPTEAMMLAGWTRQFMNVGATLGEAVELANNKLVREEDVRFLKEGWSSAIDAALDEQVTG